MASSAKRVGAKHPPKTKPALQDGPTTKAGASKQKIAKRGRGGAVRTEDHSGTVSATHTLPLTSHKPLAQDQEGQASGSGSGTSPVGPKGGRPSSEAGVKSPTAGIRSPTSGVTSPMSPALSPGTGAGKSKAIAAKTKGGTFSPKPAYSNAGAGVVSSKPDDSIPGTGIASPKTGVASPRAGAAKSKTNMPKTKSGVLSPKRDDSTPRPGIASPRSGIASPRAGAASSKKNIPKKKSGFLSPNRDDSSPGAGIASPRTGAASPTAGAARPKTNPPKTKSGTLSPKPEGSSPGAGIASPKTGVASPRTGVASPRQAAASPRAGIASPRTGASGPKAGVTSTTSGGLSPKAGARSPRSGTGSTKSAPRGAASPVKTSAPGSVSPKPKSDRDDDEPEPPVLPKTRRLAVGSRRKSVGAAAMLRIVRKSLKPQTADEGTTVESMSSKDQLSLFMVAGVGGFIFVFVIIVTFFYLISGGSIPEGVACVSEECKDALEFLEGLLDQAKDPCADFYGYVCDSWRQKGTSFHADAALSLLFRLNATLFVERKDFRKDEQRQGMHILGPVYRSCYHYMSTPGDLKEALQEAQTVLLIRQLMNAASFFDVVRYLVRQSLQAGTRKVFNDYLPQAQHVFFSRFCLLWCSAAVTSGALTPREKCMLPLYNMEEFAERYSCKGHANFTITEVCHA